jgi:hypothetical protein
MPCPVTLISADIDRNQCLLMARGVTQHAFLEISLAIGFDVGVNLFTSCSGVNFPAYSPRQSSDSRCPSKKSSECISHLCAVVSQSAKIGLRRS